MEKSERNAKLRERWKNDPEFRERTLAISRKWKENNREKMLENARKQNNARYHADIEKNRERQRNYYHNRNDEQMKNLKEYHKKWSKKNEEYLKQYRKENKDEWNARTREKRHQRRLELIGRLGGKCVECGATERLQFDHIDPLEKSFNITPNLNRENLDEELDKCQLLCFKCHLEKTKNEWLNGKLYQGIAEERLDIT